MTFLRQFSATVFNFSQSALCKIRPISGFIQPQLNSYIIANEAGNKNVVYLSGVCSSEVFLSKGTGTIVF